MQACQRSTLRWNTLAIFAVSRWHGWSNGAVLTCWGGKMASTSSMHIFQIYCDVTWLGQTRREPILQCVMSASLELYILRPKQSLWIREPAVEENLSALKMHPIFLISYLLWLWPPCLAFPFPNLNPTPFIYSLFLLFSYRLFFFLSFISSILL